MKSKTSRATFASLMIAGLLALPGATAPAIAVPADDGKFTVFAHRGLVNAKTTENTSKSFRNLLKAKVKAFEVDVALTKDRKFLLMHDVTLDRTTTCRGRVADYTMKQIQSQCRGLASKEKIPKMQAAVKFAATNNMRLILEAKPNWKFTPDDFKKFTKTIDKHEMMSKTLIHSYHLPTLLNAEIGEPRLHTQFITNTWADVMPQIDKVDGFNIYAKYLTKKRVTALHLEGKYILGRNSMSTADWAKIKKTGADGFVTDSPERAAQMYQK